MPTPPLELVRWEHRFEILQGPESLLVSLLESPAFPPWLLHEAALDSRVNIRYLVASHPKVRSDTLALLSHDPESEIRKAVAMAQSTPPVTLEFLLLDLEPEVRAAAASHGRLMNDKAIELLSQDSDARVRQGVVRSVRFVRRQPWLVKLAADPNALVRGEVAANRWTEPALLDQLSQDQSSDVRCQAAKHLDLSWNALLRLTEDPTPEVSAAAKTRLQEAQECLLNGQGETLWRQLVARYGIPQPAEGWSQNRAEEMICFETSRDGYGGGSLATGARPEDFEPGQFGTLSVYRFPSPIAEPNWQRRLSNNPWESLSDIPFLPR